MGEFELLFRSNEGLCFLKTSSIHLVFVDKKRYKFSKTKSQVYTYQNTYIYICTVLDFGSTFRKATMSSAGQQQLRFLGAAQNRRSQPIPSHEWERHREQLLRMRYEMSVKDISTVMERDHGFIATKDQYNNQFKKWKWSKHGVPANNSSNKGLNRKNAPATVVHQDRIFRSPPSRDNYTSTPGSSSSSSSSALSSPTSLIAAYSPPLSSTALLPLSPLSSSPSFSSSTHSSYVSSSEPSSPAPSSSASSPPSSSSSLSSRHHHHFRTYKNFSHGSRAASKHHHHHHHHNKRHEWVSGPSFTSTGPSASVRSPARSSTRSSSRGSSRRSGSAEDPRATTPSLISDTETTCSGHDGSGGSGRDNGNGSGGSGGGGSSRSSSGEKSRGSEYYHRSWHAGQESEAGDYSESGHHCYHYNQHDDSASEDNYGQESRDEEEASHFYYENENAEESLLQFDHQFLLAVKGLAPDPLPSTSSTMGFVADSNFNSAREWLDINDVFVRSPHHQHPMWDEMDQS